MYFGVNVNDVVRICKSKKNNKLIAYAPTGKVILIKNQKDLKIGFGKIVELIEKEKYYIATLEQTSYDVYFDSENGDIPYNELEEVLVNLNFTKELRLPIKETSFNVDDDNFFEVWANLNTGDLITIETWYKDGIKSYNSIQLYMPIKCKLLYSMPYWTGFRYGGGGIYSFDVNFCKNDTPLHSLLRMSDKSKNWNGETPSMWHYGDGHDFSFSEVLKRIYECKDDIGTLFNMQIEKTLSNYKKWGSERA